MNTNELKKRIRESKSIKDKGDRLQELQFIAEDLANTLIYNMRILEVEIEFVLDRTPQKIKDELGYNSVEDITQNINLI